MAIKIIYKQKKSERIEKQIERQIKLGKDPKEAREEVLAKQVQHMQHVFQKRKQLN